MLNYWKLRKDFGIEHFHHALIDLAPTVPDARNVEQHRRMFPEWTLFDIIDEANRGKIHVCLALVLDNVRFCNISGFRSAFDRSLEGHGLHVGGDGTCELS